MKILNTAPIAPGIAMYIKGGTLAFLQLAYKEALAELTTSRIGSTYDTTKGYVLNGCVNSGSGSSYVISAGSIFFSGEVYLVPAETFTISGSNIAEGIITTTQYIADADPTDFTDGNQRNVHNIRQIVFSPALAGSGACDFVNLVRLSYRPVGGIGQTIIWNIPSGVVSDYFNLSTSVGIHPLTLGWNIDTTMGGNVAAGFINGDANFGTVGGTNGSLTHTITAAEVPVLATSGTFSASAGGSIPGYAKSNTSTTLGTEGVNTGSPNTPISLLQPTVTKLFITRVA